MRLLETLLDNVWVTTGAAAGVVAGLGLLVKRFSWAQHVMHAVVYAYSYADAVGALDGLKGTQKLLPFGEKIVEQFLAKHGRPPTVKEMKYCLKKMEQYNEETKCEEKGKLLNEITVKGALDPRESVQVNELLTKIKR